MTPSTDIDVPRLEQITPLVAGNNVAIHAINNAGEVVGDALSPDNFRHAIFWGNSIDGTQDLGLMIGLDTIPTDINDNGILCGTLDGSGGRAWRLGSSGYENLGKLQKGKYGWSQASGVNIDGKVVGTSTLDFTTTRAFLYTDSGGMQDLGTLGGRDSWGTSINGVGEVVGKADLPDDLSDHAFLYTEGVMHDLEDAIPGFSSSIYYGLLEPSGINDAGIIFGTTSNGTGLEKQAFVLTPN